MVGFASTVQYSRLKKKKENEKKNTISKTREMKQMWAIVIYFENPFEFFSKSPRLIDQPFTSQYSTCPRC